MYFIGMAMKSRMRKDVPSDNAIILNTRIGLIGVDLSASLKEREKQPALSWTRDPGVNEVRHTQGNVRPHCSDACRGLLDDGSNVSTGRRYVFGVAICSA
jgi:hypothetical protein